MQSFTHTTQHQLPLERRSGILCNTCGRFCPGQTQFAGRSTRTAKSMHNIPAIQPLICKSISSQAAATHAMGSITCSEVPIVLLKELTQKALIRQGFQEQDVAKIAEILLYAQMRDNSQGLIKLTSGDFRASPEASSPAPLVSSNAISGLIDGRHAPGMVVMERASKAALAKAQAHGIGVVGTFNTCNGTGALGYYAEYLAQRGYIGLAMSGCVEYVAPHGATEAVFGTNPLAYAFPLTDGQTPIACDMSTAAAAYYELMEAKAVGSRVAADLGYDASGQPTTDPAAILHGGAIRTFDSAKGSNIALLVELLTGPLVGAAVSDKLASRNWGNLVIAVDPALLRGSADACKQAAAELAVRVTSARPSGSEPPRLPGQRSAQLAAARDAQGTVPIPTHMLDSLKKMAAEYDASATQGRTNGVSGNGKSSAATSQSAGPAYSLATRLVHPETVTSIQDPYRAAAPVLYQTSTFEQPSATTFGPFDYTRSGNPTRTQLEEQIADMEGADRAFAFSSGMSAIAAVCRLVKVGEHIVAGDDLYGGTSRLLASVVPNAGVEVTNVDTTNIEAVKAAIRPGKTKFVFLESPTNPRMQVCDIKAISKIAHEAGALVMVDNSIMAMYQRPLELGADISMISATKFISGHSDVTAGTLAAKGEELGKQLYFVQNAEGTGLGPWDCWLSLRGLKTMPLRMERSASNTLAIARFLEAHPLVQKVNYPGLPSSPDHSLHFSQADSGGSVLSFTTGSLEASKIIVEQTKLFKITVSFGSVSSLISLPCYMSHSSIPKEVREARGLPDDLVRISTGVEDIADLLADLEQAMEQGMKAANANK